MSVSWEAVTFGELSRRGLLAIGDGYRAKLQELGGTGPIFLRAGKLSSEGIDWAEPERFLDELADRVAIKMGHPGDTMITTKGNSVGRTAFVPPGSPPFVYSPHLSYWRSLDREQLEPGFLRYWSRGSEFHRQLQAMAHGTDMAPYLSLADQQRVVVTLPNISSQRGIAATLGALDDKIESNRSAKRLIFELADATYLAACGGAAKTVPLGDVADFHNRHRVPLSSQERARRVGPYPYYGATGVFGHVDDYLFDRVLVLVGEDGTVVNDDGTPVTQYVWGKTWINNHAHPLTGRGVPNEFLLLALRHSDVRPIVTGAVQPKISMGNLKRLELLIPPDHVIGALSIEVDILFDVYRHLYAETAKLIELRDTLLPELLSGRISVPEAHQVVRSLQVRAHS